MNFSTELIFALATILLIPIYYYFTKLRRIEKFFENFPNPPTVPILGNARDFRSGPAFFKSIHEYTRKYGNMVHIKIGRIGHVLLASDYKFLEFLLSHNKLLTKSINLKFLEPWIGTGLVTANGGPKWKTHRRLITPAFHFKILEQFVDIFENAGNILIQKLSKESGEKSVDIYPYVTRCTLDVICETAMGTKVDVQNSETSLYFHSVKEMCRIFLARTTSILKRYDSIFRFTKDYEIQKKSVEVLHGYTKSVINSKRKELEETRKEGNYSDVDDLGRKKKKVFLDLILEATVDGQSLSDEEIREEVDTFMFGGHDTTATATSFILYCLAQNKDVQDKVLEEQEQIFGGEKCPKVTYTNLQEMKYLENVIKEGLRLYSPVPLFGRQIDQDVEYDGKIIPNGVGVIVFSHGIHMNPEYYPNPEKFDPSRFDNVEGKQPFAFIPFSAGPRNCIGQKYAMLEIKCLLSKIVRNFELSPAFPRHEMILAPETVLKSLNGVKIGIKSR
jgi:cytochrome P450 family 4